MKFKTYLTDSVLESTSKQVNLDKVSPADLVNLIVQAATSRSRSDLKKSLERTTDLSDVEKQLANLEQIVPGVHTFLDQVEQALSDLKNSPKLDELIDSFLRS